MSGSRTVALIARLALTAGACVPAEVLLDDIWEGRFPEGGVATLRRLASRTRTRLTEHHLDIGPIPDGGGYQLMLEPEQVDALRFERLAEEGAHLLRENLPTRAYDTLTQALSLWEHHFPGLSRSSPCVRPRVWRSCTCRFRRTACSRCPPLRALMRR